MSAWAFSGVSAWWALLACVGLSACGGASAQELRLSEELGRAKANAAWHEAQTAELSSRLSRLEQRVAADATAHAARERELASPTFRPVPVESLAPTATAATQTPALTKTPAATKTSSTKEPRAESELEGEAELRALVERLRGQPGRFKGPLTREQNAALRVLLKPQRQLDSENPWPQPWY